MGQRNPALKNIPWFIPLYPITGWWFGTSSQLTKSYFSEGLFYRQPI
jgi:hypothetical protein